MGKVLIVDDEPYLRRILIANLKQDRHDVIEAAGLSEARLALSEHSFDAVITDQKMADGEGLHVLAVVRETDPSLSLVILTAFATIELAIESMRRGAFDFITKPFVPEVLLASARRAMITRAWFARTIACVTLLCVWKVLPRSRGIAPLFVILESKSPASHPPTPPF